LSDTPSNSGPWFHYRREDGITLIELKLVRIEQLFNSFDPLALPRKGSRSRRRGLYRRLAARPCARHPGEDRRLSAGREPHGARGSDDAGRHPALFRLLPRRRAPEIAAASARRPYVALARSGFFLFACIALRQIFFSAPASTFGEIVAEGLLILGWVAMWRPMETLLYDWWPVRRLVKPMPASPPSTSSFARA